MKAISTMLILFLVFQYGIREVLFRSDRIAVFIVEFSDYERQGSEDGPCSSLAKHAGPSERQASVPIHLL